MVIIVIIISISILIYGPSPIDVYTKPHAPPLPCPPLPVSPPLRRSGHEGARNPPTPRTLCGWPGSNGAGGPAPQAPVRAARPQQCGRGRIGTNILS